MLYRPLLFLNIHFSMIDIVLIKTFLFLPSRTILDVNIDTFEEKPWRFPGVDITDFFNFGFNEDTWKEYCNSLVNNFNYILCILKSIRLIAYMSCLFDRYRGRASGFK
jgi:hypothetical protein